MMMDKCKCYHGDRLGVFVIILMCFLNLCKGVNAITVEGCENDDIVLSCAAETGTITITNVFYGRMNNDRCMGTNSGTTTTCISDTAQNAVEMVCNRKEECTFLVNNANLGESDPCQGVFKMITVDFICEDPCSCVSCPKPQFCEDGVCVCPNGYQPPDCNPLLPPIITSIACEGDTLSISCGTRKISILRAVYGREHDDECSGRNSDTTTDCVAAASMSTVVAMCQDMMSCFVTASSGVFGGDPCSGVFKYLEVEYSCVVPTVTCPDDVQVTCDPSSCEGAATWIEPSCTDGFEGTATVSCDPAADTNFLVGSDIPVTCTCIDDFGNTASCSFRVIVTAPTFVTIVSDPDVALNAAGVVSLTAITNTASLEDTITLTEIGEEPRHLISETTVIPFGNIYQITSSRKSVSSLFGTHKTSVTYSDGTVSEITTFVRPKSENLDTGGVYTVTGYPDMSNPKRLKDPLIFGIFGSNQKFIWTKNGKTLRNREPTLRITTVSGAEGIYTIRRQRQRVVWCVQIQVIIAECPRGFFSDSSGTTCTGTCGCTGGTCPGTTNQCPCLNGGVCGHDGKCLCPPCFQGRYCERPKQNTREILKAVDNGRVTTFTCSDIPGGSDDCRCSLFCYGELYGCRCGCGWRGNGCNKKCQRGWYGAGCLQKCNCMSDSQCHHVTGACTGPCPTGFTGFNCQLTE
ncbi:uncharacterized protein [Apostichopus japonicus]|uniref:uncharacterized protein n=1 Tax=Stichopus japonicus TaxID=307972 RepID=UPI003AB2F063